MKMKSQSCFLPTQVLATGGNFVAVSDDSEGGAEEMRQRFTKTSAMTSLILNFDWFNNTHFALFALAGLAWSRKQRRL